MKWIRRLLVALLLIVGLFLAGVFSIIAIDTVAGELATEYTNVTYPAEDGTTLNGYLATPEGEGPFPGVIMVHEWWGLNAEIVEMADRLAEQGYVVLAPDTYRGPTTRQVPRAIFLRVTVPEDRVDADMQAAFDYLAGREDVSADRIGVMGFCYGGGVALRHGVRNAEIAAVINLYGDTITDSENFGTLPESGAPVLGIFGSADMQIPVSEVEAFDAALDGAGIPNTVTIYEDMPHAFVQPDNIDEPGAPQDAWEQIIAFLDETLKTVE